MSPFLLKKSPLKNHGTSGDQWGKTESQISCCVDNLKINVYNKEHKKEGRDRNENTSNRKGITNNTSN